MYIKQMVAGKIYMAAKKQAPLNVRQKKQVKRLINVRQELRYFDQNAAAAGVATSGSVLGALVLPTQGNGESQRNGDTLEMRKLSIDFQFTAVDTYNVLRFVVFQWQENNSANAPTIAKIFEQVAIMPWLSKIKHDYIAAGTLKIMHDKVYTSMTLSDTATIVRRVEFSGKKLHKKKVEYDAAAVTGWDNYYIAVLSDSGAVSHPTFGYTCRATYST